MSGQAALEITVPNVKISLDQLIEVIRQLNEAGRARVAQVLLDTMMDQELRGLLSELSGIPPAEDICHEEIQAEVRAVRESRARR